MFGTLRSLAARAKAALALVKGAATLPQPQTPRYNGPAIPVCSWLMRALAHQGPRPIWNHANGGRKQRTQGKRDRSLKMRSNRRKAARAAKYAAIAFAFALPFGFAPSVQAQTVTVSASNLYDGSSPANGTITFAPVLSNGQAASYRYPGGGQRTVGVYAATVTNGAFTITLPDTSQTSPVNLCFNVVLTGTRNRLGAGYSCVQPAASNSWCTAGVCNFDNYTPNESPLVLSQAGPTGPQGPAGAGFIAGLASDGANGIAVQGKVSADSGSVTTDGSGNLTMKGITVIAPSAQTGTYTAQITSTGAYNNQLIGVGIEQELNPTITSSWYNFGQTTELFTPDGNTQNFTGGDDSAVYGSFSHFGSGSLDTGIGGNFEAFNSGPAANVTLLTGMYSSANNGGVDCCVGQTPTNNGSAANLRGVDTIVKNLSTGTVTNAAGVYVEGAQNTGGGSITNLYGLIVQDQTGATNNYAIFTGTGKVQFGDIVNGSSSITAGTTLNAGTDINGGGNISLSGGTSSFVVVQNGVPQLFLGNGGAVKSTAGASSFYNGLFLDANSNSNASAQANTAVASWREAIGSGSAEWCNNGTGDAFCVGRVAAGGTFSTPTTFLKISNSGAITPAPTRKGTFVCTAGGTITVSNTNELATSDVIISLNAASGTISTPPAMKTVTAGVGFSVSCGASDTSTYNYDILN